MKMKPPLPPEFPFVFQRWQVAAALSAAVTITKPIGDAPTSQAEPTQKKSTPQTPAALWERGVWGERGFSQRSRLSPQHLPTRISSGGSAREGASLQRSPLPRNIFIL